MKLFESMGLILALQFAIGLWGCMKFAIKHNADLPDLVTAFLKKNISLLERIYSIEKK